jgi:hypothetical protein
MQHHSWRDGRFPRHRRAGHGRVDMSHERSRQLHTDGCPLFLGHRRERPADEPLQVKRDPVRCIGRSEWFPALFERRLRVAQARFERLGDQDLV